MSLNENVKLRIEPKLLPERNGSMNAEQKLQKSLAHRAQSKEDSALVSHDLGTAEHRPRKGLIYDAPLGLKF